MFVLQNNGMTALHYATNNNHKRAADFLLFCGADCSLKDQVKRTCYFYMESNFPDVEFTFLVSNGILHRQKELRITRKHKRKFDIDPVYLNVQVRFATSLLPSDAYFNLFPKRGLMSLQTFELISRRRRNGVRF